MSVETSPGHYTDSEWTPEYLQKARELAAAAAPGKTYDSGDAVALAMREVAAEIRALRHALCGSNRRPPASGALGE